MHAAALLIAAAAALGFAVSTSLQHHANAGLVGGDDFKGSTALLLRQPWWLVGQVVALLSFGLHAWALHLGALVLVQPVVVSGIVLAIPVHAALARRLPHWGELTTVMLTAAGLGTFLVVAHPRPATTAFSTAAAVVTAAGALLALVVARWARSRHGVSEAAGYGLASGVLFGLCAGLVKLAIATASASHGGWGQVSALATAWPTWAVPVVGVTGVALNQRAYRAGPLSASMPLLNIVDVLVAVLFGVLVFNEMPAHQPLALLAQTIALLLMAIGLRRLARHHADSDGQSHTRQPASSEGRP